MSSQHIRIATRGSALALWQAHFVQSKLKDLGLSTELLILKTTGDIQQDRFLRDIGGKGVFVRELEDALLEGRADIAVHSLKDIPLKQPPGLELAAIMARHTSGDLFITRDADSLKAFSKPLDFAAVQSLPAWKIGTSSLRRESLLRSANPKLDIAALRGNVDTRLRKLMEGQFDAIILAQASVERLKLTVPAAQTFATDWFVPCAGQGALCIEAKEESPFLATIHQLACPITTRRIAVERLVLKELGGDCNMPFGCFVEEIAASGAAQGYALVATPAGKVVRSSHRATLLTAEDVITFARHLLEGLLKNQVNAVLQELNLPPLTLKL